MHWWEAVSLLVSAVALGVAALALRRSDLNSSAASLIALNEGLHQAWRRFLKASAQDRDYEFAELCNALEIACAILDDKALHGNALGLVDELLEQMLGLIDENADATARMESLRETGSTFEYLLAFLRGRRKRPVLHS